MLSLPPNLTLQVAHDFEGAIGEKGAGRLLSTDEWDALLHSSASDVVFMTWEWQRVWWRHFGAAENCKLHLLAVRAEDGALLGLAPLFIAEEPLPPLREYRRHMPRPVGEGQPLRIVRFVGGIEIADYLDVLAPAERLPQVWSAVLDYLLQHRDEWDCIDLHSLPQFSPSREILASIAVDKGLTADVIAEDVSPVVQLPGSWDEYLAHLRKKDRHELRRKVRKLEGREDTHWRLVPCNDCETIDDAMRSFIHLHRSSGADKAAFMDERMASFFMEMGSELVSTGWLELAMLDIGDHPASGYLSFKYRDRLYLYNSGMDPRFASYSAGMALLAYRIHKAILQDLRYFDFLRGDEPYKYDFGGKDTYVYRALLRPERA